MLRQIEGSRAIADAVAMCRPEVICAYPITPQTHIVEAPVRAVREALGGGVQRVVVLERALATGMGGIVTADLRMALAGGNGPGRRRSSPRSSPAWAGAPSRGPRCAPCSPAPRPARSSRCRSST